ncbi:hypothetical protein LshimejAT787_2400540 [Lyophyllum shimeji]|uniref:Uncharacterized protein n=1 Tax=Lyophyllum shimeji TaxID=47721 RepID=A0A9P3UWY4_LYOSH|nr:hypothetical protein LshimejAT787_2400540 [Lyophyllum shimeji]
MSQETSAPPPYDLWSNHATERSPLLSAADQTRTPDVRYRNASEVYVKRRQRQSCETVICILAIALALSSLIAIAGARIDRAWDSVTHDKIRRSWALEEQRHVREVLRWKDEQHERRAEEADLRRRIAGFEAELKRKIEREKRERERARVYWDDIHGAEHCLSNGRKKYSARLANLPDSIDAMEACKATPVTINGITCDTPMHCEDRGRSGGVVGHWIAENEGLCAAYWELVKEKHCTAPNSGLRRIEAKLSVVHPGEDPEILCLTTPLTIKGHTYERPLACPHWGEHGFWGIWNLPDDACQ